MILLRYAEGHDSTTQARSRVSWRFKAHPGIEVVSSNQYGGADVEGAYKQREALLSAQGRRRHARRRRHLRAERVERLRAAARAAGQRVGRQGEVRRLRRLGPLVRGLRDGAIDGLVVQDPVKMGYLSGEDDGGAPAG